MEVLKIEIENIHCGDCHTTIQSALSQIFNLENQNDDLPKAQIKIIDDYEVNIVSKKEFLTSRKIQRQILNNLEKKGFIVKDYTLHDIDEEANDLGVHSKFSQFFIKLCNGIFTRKIRNPRERHLQSCKECREKENSKANDDCESELSQVITENLLEYRAVFIIGGMTCSSCAGTVSNAIKEVLQTSKADGLESKLSVDVISNTAVVILPNKQMANCIINEVKKSGYTATLVEILPVTKELKYKVHAAIGGISCAACASSITAAVGALPFLVEHAISVVSKTGVFIIDNKNQKTLDELKETIEDCGFDFEIVDIVEVSHVVKTKTSRSVNLRVDGMFCEHCPDNIMEILNKHGDAIVIEEPITLSHPFVKFTYLPSPPNLTIRSILDEIKANSQLKVEIIKDISLDEHLRRIAKKETLKILYRLILTTIIAIPSFIFGIVGMSLLQKENSFKMWLDEPMWVGNVSKMTWIMFFLATPIYFCAADVFHTKAIKEIRTLWKGHIPWTRRLFRFGSMNLLMSLGTSVSYFASILLLGLAARTKTHGHGGAFTTNYFDSVVFLTFFLLIGRLLESYSKSKTAEAITSLGSLKSSVATLIEDGEEIKLPLNLLEVNDFIRVVPGESPALDCIITQGKTKFDESALTGESIPVEHDVGEQIFAGTINKGPSSIIAKISALDGTSLIDQIVTTVRDGQMRRAPIERSADILTGVFVPIITAIAILTWVIWISLGYTGKLPLHYLTNDIGGWAIWSLEFAIAVFVIACPCGIGLAAPTAIFVGAGLAARNGILARGGGAAFQEGSKVNIVCFDKTGTLTMGGDLRITNYALYNDDVIKKFALQIAKDLETNSNHPLAVAVKVFINKLTTKKNIKLTNVKVPEAEEIPGKGLKGRIILDEDENDQDWVNYKPTDAILGNETLMKEYQVSFTSNQLKLLNDWKAQGKSIIILSIKCPSKFQNDKYQPVFLLSSRDEIRPEAHEVIKQLNDSNIETWIISGDNYLTASSIAKELNIKNVIAEVLPEEKAEKIKWIRETHTKSTVAMVGDGINDAPALAVADVGVALASGSELALTSSDFVLLSPSFPLVTLLTLLKLSRKVFQRVRFNFGWALVYNMIGVPIAAGVIYPYKNSKLSPVWASAAMALSSISVVLSSLALKFFKKPKIVVESAKTLKDFEAIEEKM